MFDFWGVLVLLCWVWGVLCVCSCRLICIIDGLLLGCCVAAPDLFLGSSCVCVLLA